MSTIVELNNEIRKLQKKNDPWEKQLTTLLLKQTTEQQLDAEQERKLDDQIKIFDKRISDNNQLILQNKKQITAQINLEISRNQGKSAASIDSL